MLSVSVVPKRIIQSKMVDMRAGHELCIGLKNIHDSLILEHGIVKTTFHEFIDIFLSFTRVTDVSSHLLLCAFVKAVNLWVKEFPSVHLSIYIALIEEYIKTSQIEVTEFNIATAHQAIVLFSKQKNTDVEFSDFIHAINRKRNKSIASKRIVKKIYTTAMSGLSNEDVQWFSTRIDETPETMVATIPFDEDLYAQLLAML